MKIRRFFGKDMREALKQVKDELGGEAVIMSNKKVANGVELVAAIDPTVSQSQETHIPASNHQQQNIQSSQANNSSQARHKNATEQHLTNHGQANKTPTLSEIIGDSGPDSLHALLEQQRKSIDESNANISATIDSHAQTPNSDELDQANQSIHYSQQANYGALPEPRADDRIFRSPAFAEPEPSEQRHNNTQASAAIPPPSVLEPDQIDSIKAELESIKNVLKFQVSELADERKKRNNPVHHYLHDQMIKMGISKDLTKQFIEFLPHKIDEKQGWKYILNLLSNRLQVGGNDILKQSGVVALVGPTGTGKTTTLAKLAAKYAQKFGPEQVALVTIDTYRIAAFEQLATYGKIIGCAVKKAHNSQELNDILYQLRNKKLVLIDTAGFSQRDSRLIQQIKDYQSNISVNIRKFLVLPAGSQYQVLNQTLRAYEHTDISGCIFTKLDECYSLGEALSVMIENDMSLSYVTDGQRVPEDIKLADSANLTLIAAKLFNRYGNDDAPTSIGKSVGGV